MSDALTDVERAEIASIWIGVVGARSMQDAAERTYLAGKRSAQEQLAAAERLIQDLRGQVYDARFAGAELHNRLATIRSDTIEECARVCEELSFLTDVSKLLTMTKKEMSERACYECAAAIRALAARAEKP